jgi:formylmethanofuran dehydrogenase subunit C
MSTTTLRVRSAPGCRVDAERLVPAALAALTVAEIGRIVLPAGNETCAAGDLFDISRTEGDVAALVIEGEVQWLDRLGANLAEGRIDVQGSVGNHTGFRMAGGELRVSGHAGAGTIGIAGKLGPHYGYGMRRGTLLLAHAPAHMPPTFTAGGQGFDVFWSLMVRSLATEIAPFSMLKASALPRRYTGDLAVDGRGELLIVG